MRIYTNFPEALNEIKRDVVEMGIRVHSKSWQDKDVSDDPDFESLEVQNYMYTVTNPKLGELKPVQPWSDAEWDERKLAIETGIAPNPGQAWRYRPQVWRNFLDDEGKFGYTYGDRLMGYGQVESVISRAIKDPDSRQLFVSIWQESDSENLGGVSRVPCTLGYQFQIREDALNIMYIQRSADLSTHVENDIYLAHRLQRYVAEKVGVPVGRYSHLIMSLHLFKKDAYGVF